VNSHISQKARDTRISCTRFHPVQRVRLSLKESRKKVANSTELHRKSGGMGHPNSWANTFNRIVRR
jgi:hypothetical protein